MRFCLRGMLQIDTATPVHFCLTLHRWRLRFLNLSPVGRPPRPITRAEALRDDPLNARFARMLEHYRAAIALGTFCAAELFFRISQEVV
jgi:hypothetical protein